MKIYVQRLPQILAKKKLLATHTAIAECIKDVTDSYEFLDTLQVKIIVQFIKLLLKISSNVLYCLFRFPMKYK